MMKKDWFFLGLMMGVVSITLYVGFWWFAIFQIVSFGIVDFFICGIYRRLIADLTNIGDKKE